MAKRLQKQHNCLVLAAGKALVSSYKCMYTHFCHFVHAQSDHFMFSGARPIWQNSVILCTPNLTKFRHFLHAQTDNVLSFCALPAQSDKVLSFCARPVWRFYVWSCAPNVTLFWRLPLYFHGYYLRSDRSIYVCTYVNVTYYGVLHPTSKTNNILSLFCLIYLVLNFKVFTTFFSE